MDKRKRGAVRLRRLLASGVIGAMGFVGWAAAPALAADAAPAGTLMAKLGATTTSAEAAAVAERSGLTHVATLEEIGWAAYEYTGDRLVAHDALRSDPAVFRIDFTRAGDELVLHFTPRDTVFDDGITVALNGQPVAQGAWHWTKTNFPAAWDITRSSSAIRIAVIDSEFDTEHSDLKTKLATGKNFDSGSSEYLTTNVRGTDPNNTHGSHVAGLIGAVTDNGVGVSGACFDCTVIPFKIGTNGVVGGAPNVDAKFVADLTEALVAAGQSDAVAINMSLGTTRDHAPLREAVAFARNAGKVVVASAGNSQQQQPGVPNYPAAYPGVIAVAATMPDDSIAPFSTNGDFVDIAAPGHPILSTWDSRLTGSHGAGYNAISGTSMSSPIVAGLVGLVKSVRSDLTPDEVEAVITGSAVDLGASGRDPIFGAGRINAVAALRAAQAYVRPAPPPPAPPALPAPAPAPAPAPIVKTALKKVSYSCKVGRVKVPAARSAFKRLTRNTTLVCTGRVIPAKAGLKLKVERRGKAKWSRVSQVKTNKKGRFVYRTKLRATGKLQYRFLFVGNATLKKKTSPAVRVNVVKAPRRR